MRVVMLRHELSVDFSSVSDTCHTDELTFVVNLVYDTILSYPDPIQAFVSHKLSYTRWTWILAQGVNRTANTTLELRRQ